MRYGKIAKKTILFLGICFATLLFPFSVKADDCVVNDIDGDLISDSYDAADEYSILTPTSTNKKGIQGTEYIVPGMRIVGDQAYIQNADEAPLDLEVNHVLLNFDIAKLLASDSQTEEVINYNYNGVTYRFNKSYLIPYLYRVRQYQTMSPQVTDRPVAITFVLLMSKPEDPKYDYLLCPGALQPNDGLHMFYALNIQDPVAKETISAVFDYLTRAFGDKEHFVQNWIIGNEVDVPDVYNYTGTHDATYNACVSAETFNLFYDKLCENTPYAKAYISLTNRWNTTSDGTGIGGKTFLELFSQMVQTDHWNIAFHAYAPTWDYKLWEPETVDYVCYSADSPYVCAANLAYMTDYVKNVYGDNHRIILSEQGFNVKDNSMEEQYAQAAELIYTYFAAARNDMVDAVIFNNWYDCSYQADLTNLHIGLHDDAGNKREAYYAFKYMDTDVSQITKYQDYVNHFCTSFPSWDCNILYTDQPTIAVADVGNQTLLTEAQIPWNGLYSNHLYYRWTVINEQTKESQVIQDWLEDNNAIYWTTDTSGVYTLVCEIMTSDQRLYRTELICTR